ncbi:MAG: hypothetical protein ABR909_14215 [Candidatus Bathyarchaeia archaeon]|jgi:hypothetical protein
MDEESALAVIYSNTKRHKRSLDLLTIAENFAYLKKLYGTQEAVAQKTDLSREMVREFLQILTLPDFVQQLIKTRRIDSIDVAYRLSKIRDINTLENSTSQLLNLPAHDIRDIIQATRENIGLSVDSAREIILKTKPTNLHLFILDFSEMDYKKLNIVAKNNQCSPAEIIKKITEDWLKSTKGEKK